MLPDGRVQFLGKASANACFDGASGGGACEVHGRSAGKATFRIRIMRRVYMRSIFMAQPSLYS
jgi:hypothetical protein